MDSIDGNRESHAYGITFRSLSEDKPHLDVRSPLMKALDNQIHPQLFDSPYMQSMIFRDYYGLFCKYAHKADDELVNFLQIWNWKFKEASQCLQIFDTDCGTTNFSFLTNDRFLVTSARELKLFSLDTINSVNAIQLIARFSFPALRDPFIFHFITFSPIPFHASTHNQLIAINMCMVTDFKVGNISTSHQQLIKGESPNLTLFLDPLGPGLPYIETISQEKFLVNDMKEANRIILLSLKVSIKMLDFE
ncbi:hypothetical protein BDR06DRAFT_974919 [Suillus hirtellus]|nr:hypothetical protein BDR06DRAFT_974919 [Suillus hirtellus]